MESNYNDTASEPQPETAPTAGSVLPAPDTGTLAEAAPQDGAARWETSDSLPAEISTVEDGTAETAPDFDHALPEAPSHVPPRPLVSGAFLRGEFEIKALIARGMTNLYQASGGDYGDTVPKLIAERDVPPAAQPLSGAPAETVAEETGAFEEELRATELEFPNESAQAQSVPSLLPAGDIFAQDDREYCVFDYFDSDALQDYREPMNDERLLAVLHSLVQGMLFLEQRGLAADLTTETLRIDGGGALRYVGFATPITDPAAPLLQLRVITDYLLKHVFAESSTMRLDDRFAGLALSEEVKDLARHIDEDAPVPYASLAEVAAAIDVLYSPGRHISVDEALLTDVGQERELNEDAGMIVRSRRAAHLGTRDLELYVVSDGMGGHEGGEVASDLTLSSLQRHIDELEIDWNDNVSVRAALGEVIDAVNADVVALTETPKYKGTRAKPGATLVFALRIGIRIFVGNVGDSRAYRFNKDGLRRISKDHSYVQGLLDRGEITEDEAWDHPEGSIITAHIGYPKLKTRDVFLRLAIPGDKLLLVSDGVVDMLRDREIEAYLQTALAQNDSSATICRDLVDASNAAGGFDNITVVCVGFS